MAAYMGKDGYVTAAGSTVAYIDSWSLNASVGTAEITGYGNSAKAYTHTIRDASVSFTGTMDRSDAEQATLMDQFEDATLADVAIRLYVLPATYWSGNVRLTGMTVNSAVGDKVSITWNGSINGALAYTSS
jgi:hypothetical protein